MGLLEKAGVEQIKAKQIYKKSVEAFIEDYAKRNGAFQCIVFNCDMHALYGMISHFGSVLELDKGNCLVLIPKNVDCKLLVHRLSESLKITPIYQSSAGRAIEAFTGLEAFM
jgi:hypothetical protein